MSSLLEDLLPGIPDEVTVAHIATKLPWIALRSLSIVSLRWQRAIQTRQVYDERVRCHSTETLAVVKLKNMDKSTAIFLYSMREKGFYRLPPIPQLQNGYPCSSHFVSQDGTLYVLGAVNDDDKEEIYSLDLAGEMKWKECESLPRPLREYRCQIGCGVMQRGRFYVRGGSVDWFETLWHAHDGPRRDVHGSANDVYRSLIAPVLLFWPLGGLTVEMEFWVQGNIYRVTRDGIYVHTTPTRSWTLLHSTIACDELGSVDSVTFNPLFILPLNNELLAMVRWYKHDRTYQNWPPTHGYCLLHSRGFGTENIVWEKGPNCFHSYDPSFAMCPIQL